MREGIDCASKITKPVAEKLKALGYTFVARYMVSSQYEWKRLSPEEAQIISDAGMDILSVYESTASRAIKGLDAGRQDAKICLEEVKRLGQPSGSAIYFAVDFDVTTPQQMDLIEQYLRGASEVLGSSYAVGVYGEYSVIEEMAKRKACKHFWQTYAWSGGKRSKSANVYQYKNAQQAGGITVDFNSSFGNEGFWNLRAVKPKGIYPDVPDTHWASNSIKIVKDAGFLVGFADGTFKPDQPITRAEAAALVARLLEVLK